MELAPNRIYITDEGILNYLGVNLESEKADDFFEFMDFREFDEEAYVRVMNEWLEKNDVMLRVTGVLGETEEGEITWVADRHSVPHTEFFQPTATKYQ